jgi:Acetyltransferase (GNAT) domain
VHPVKSRVVAIATLTDTDYSAWLELLGRAVDPYPFLDPRMLASSAPHRDSAMEMQVLFVEDDSRLLAVMPIRVWRTYDRISLKVVTSRSTFLQHNSMWDHPIVDAERAVDALEGILVGLRDLDVPRLVEFFSVPAGGVLENSLYEACRRLAVSFVVRDRREFTFSRASADDQLPVDDEDPGDRDKPDFALAHTSSHTRRNYARLARRLTEVAGFEMRESDGSGDPAAIERFFELQHAGWKSNPELGGASLRGSGLDAWFRDVADRYRADGALALYALNAGDKPVHIAVNLRVGDSVFAWSDAFSEEFRPFKGGSLGRIANINRVFADPTVRNFYPDLEHRSSAVNEFFPNHGERIRIIVANGGMRSNAVVKGVPAARAFRQSLRNVASRGGLDA